MGRNVVHIDADPGGLQGLIDGAAGDLGMVGEPDDVKVPGAAVAGRRQDDRQIVADLPITPRQRPPWCNTKGHYCPGK